MLFFMSFVTGAIILGTGGIPYTQEKIVKFYQIHFQSPPPGELGIFVNPTGQSTDALMFHVRRAIYPRKHDVPVGSVVLVISCDKDEAECMWQGKIVTLPRRWIWNTSQ
jgi:hypothetical protein